MFYMFKNLIKEVLKNRIFLILLLIMTVLTSFLFFFIRFSIDANLAFLNGLKVLTENQQNYKKALSANTELALSVLLVIVGVTAVVFILFFLRFYSSAKKQIGCIKALGYNNIQIQVFLALFAAILSTVGLLIGMLAGYFVSSVQLIANASSYNVTDLKKGVNLGGALLGLLLPIVVFSLTMFLCGFQLYGKENGELIADTKQNVKHSKLLNFANAVVQKIPVKNKAPLRIALKKPVSLVLIVLASTVFTVMLVLGYSLTKSSEMVYRTQTEGHLYKYESQLNEVQNISVQDGAMYYLRKSGEIQMKNKTIEEQFLLGLDLNSNLYALKNMAGEPLGLPADGNCYISPAIAQMYKVKAGDKITFKTGNRQIVLYVADVAYNAKSRSVIVNRTSLAKALGLGLNSFNGVLSAENLYPSANKVIGPDERADMLRRDKVSNQTSAVINQAVGLASGIILLFLALFVSFQDNVKDMLIMDNLGYKVNEIKKLLFNVYLPILIVAFLIVACPAVMIAKGVQTSLSLQMGDFMPFSTNIWVLLVGFAVIVALYYLVQLAFTLGIKRLTKKKGILQYTNSL